MRDRFSRKGHASGNHSKYRRLLVDPLEQRQLLSLTPADWEDTLVNDLDRSWADWGTETIVDRSTGEAIAKYQTRPGDPTTLEAQSTASDNDGDFVVTWTRYDEFQQLSFSDYNPVTREATIARDVEGNPLYVPLIDPVTNEALVDANVYARYFTDEVQRITLPEGILNGSGAGYGRFSLRYGEKIVQKLTISAAYEPFSSWQDSISGSFFLGLPTEYKEVVYNEYDDPQETAERLQNDILRHIHGLETLEVRAISAREFLIEYPAAPVNGQLLQVNPTGADMNQVEWTSGFYPAATMSTVQTPLDFTDIAISPSDPNQTASAIESAFQTTAADHLIGPINFPPPDRIPSDVEGPYWSPEVLRTPSPNVAVKPVLGLRDPDAQILTFDAPDGDLLSGDFQLIVNGLTTGVIHFDSNDPAATASAIDAQLAAIGFGTAEVTVLSDLDPVQFRIKFETGSDLPPIQYLPSVQPIPADVGVRYDVMDGRVFDVTFVGASGKKDHPQMTISSAVDPLNSSTDASGTPYVSLPGVGVRTLKEPSAEFRVNPEEFDNPFTALPDLYEQTNPAVAMDADGDFVITWESEVPDSANFGSVSDVFARRFSPIGLVRYDSSGSLVDVGPGDVRGFVTPGIRSWIDDVQILTFDSASTGPISGKFRLKIGGATTDDINFESGKLEQVASDIQDRLVRLGYEGVKVRVVSKTDPYKFEVHFASRSGGVRQPLIEYVADDAQPLNVHVLPANQFSVRKQGTIAERSTFQVNTSTANAQGQPAIGMDDLGNFVIAWAGAGQDLSFFNGILAQRFDRYGGRVGNEYLVYQEDTAQHWDPYVALSNSGNFVVSWTRTPDPQVVIDPGSAPSAVFAEVYDAQGNVLQGQFGVGAGGFSSVAFDANDNWVVAWQVVQDTDSIGGTSAGVRATMYTLSGQVLRSTFRANSASDNPGSVTTWPLHQRGAQALLDADGDLVITYSGFGPDVSDNTQTSTAFWQYLQQKLSTPAYSDLAPYVGSWYLTGHPANQPGWEGYHVYGSNGDVDGVIDEMLINAWNQIEQDLAGLPTETMERTRADMIGRLRALLDGGLGLLRGEANGVMFSRWDADPRAGYGTSILFSDCVANSVRDGHNQRYILALDGGADWQAFTLRLTHPNLTGYEDVTINVARPNNVISATQTAQNINSALETAIARLGNAWPENRYEGTVDVRVVSAAEVLARQDSPWDITTWGVSPNDYVFEVTFQGEVHDTAIGMWAPSRGTVTGNEVKQVLVSATDPTQPVIGTFYIQMRDNQGNLQSRAVSFTSNNIAQSAAAIQGAIQALGFQGVQVTGTQVATGQWEFTATFRNQSGNRDIEDMWIDELHPTTGEDLLPNGSAAMYTSFQGGAQEGPYPNVVEHTDADYGTIQTDVSSAIETDGDFVLTWTQYEETTGGWTSNRNIYYRRFNEDTDTAGPLVTDVAGPESVRPTIIDEGVNLFVGADGLQYLVLSFDEDMMQTGADSVTNPVNYRLLRNGSEVRGAIVHVEYGLNKAAELASQLGLSATPSNKWEAVLTLDGNGYDPDSPALSTGQYTIMALAPVAPTATNPQGQSGLRDRAGNPLGYTGFTPNGQDFSRQFVIRATEQPDDPGQDPGNGGGDGGSYVGVNGRTYPETPGAVAVDGDGDHIRVWTAYDPTTGHDRVYVGIYDADGELATVQHPNQPLVQLLPFTVTSDGTRDQRFASVACDQDGDFVVTWTQYDDVGGQTEANVYARRFSANGTALGEAFRVNSYTTNHQKWSNVAMDTDGDFVITWSSYSQEDNNQLGSGYGIYARRYDSFGQPLASEFQVNVTTAGNQQFSNVAMAHDGSFVIVWTSDQDGVGDDVFMRAFDANGAPAATPLTGEVQVNTTTAGNQRYADISTNLDGTSYVVTWASSGQDGSGWGVYTRLFDGSLAATSGEILVNTSVEGDQHYPSVAMAHNGSFVVTWSGRGNQPAQEDDFGVFYQRFDSAGGKIGAETRVNNAIAGYQYLSSVGSDAVGNFVIAWTGVGNMPGTTMVYKYVSANSGAILDNVGPIVTDVFDADHNRLLDDDVVQPPEPGMSRLIVALNEDLSTRDLTTGLHSVLNPLNWTLERNGTEILGAIREVSIERNPATRKYEVTLTLDGNGLSAGIPALPEGDYVLTMRDHIWDAAEIFDPATGQLLGNALDGDFDGTPGTLASGTGQPGFRFHFNVTHTPKVGAEFRVNEEVGPQQRLAEATGTGNGHEESTRSIAVDHDGDFVVVWTSYGQDDPNDPTGAGVYYRVYDRNGNALTGELLAANTVVGDQLNPCVAMDADGDFIIAWQSLGDNPDGSVDVFARRFSATGEALGDEFRVNSNTINHQVDPAVAMDDAGNFVIVWANVGQDWSYFNDIHGQRYNSRGERIGSEFLVNPVNYPGSGSLVIDGYEMNPTVAMTETGHFIVAWEKAMQMQNGVLLDAAIYFQVFTFADGATVGGPVLVGWAQGMGGTETTRTSRNPQLAVSDNPNQAEFIIVWEAYNIVAGNYDVRFSQFEVGVLGPAVTDNGQINMPQFDGHQVNPSVAMDADGDFVVVWNGNGGQPDPLNPGNQALWADLDNEGIFARRYSARADSVFGNSEPIGVQTRVNRTAGGIQQFPSVGMTRNGDYVVVWSGRGVGDHQGIFARRYEEPTDMAGPMVTDFLFADGDRIEPNAQVTERLEHLVVVFDEDMSQVGPDSVTNPANYHLRKNGVELAGGIARVEFGLNMSAQLGLGSPTNKWEAVLFLDGDGATPGVVPLGDGQYELVVDNALRDKVGNPLGHSGVTINGAPFSRSFNVAAIGEAGGEQLVNSNYRLGNQMTQPESPQPVASDADGNYVAVWASEGQGVFARIYRSTWTEGPNDTRNSSFESLTTEIQITDNPTATNAAVAMDGDGDFVVTWSQNDGGASSWNVYARRFNAKGEALGKAFLVNTHTDDVQRYSTVAMDNDGDFLIAWQSFGQDGSGYGIYAQRFSPAGHPLGGTNEVQLINFDPNATGQFTLTWDDDQDPSTPDLETAPIVYSGNTMAVAEEIEARLREKGANVEIRTVSQTEVAIRFVDEDGSRNQAPLALGAGSDPILTLRTLVDGSSGEFLVNDTTLHNQVFPVAAMSAQGDIVVSWTSYGQDGDDASESNVYAKTLPRNSVVRGITGRPNYQQLASGTSLFEGAQIRPLIVASDSYDRHLSPPGDGFEGVGQVLVGGSWGSGTLLPTGRHVLTAGHVVGDAFGDPLPANMVSVAFDTLDGRVTIPASRVFVHPEYLGFYDEGFDIAIVELAEAAPADVPRFDIYRDYDEVGQIGTKYGYGVTGTGDVGYFLPDGQKRFGKNRYDCLGSVLGLPDSFLVYDFDSPYYDWTDALGVLFGVNDLGMGMDEVGGSPGDSGGPTFIDGKVAAVTTGVLAIPGSHDFLPGLQMSWGDIGFDTRTSIHADWIDSITTGSTEFLVNTTTVGNQMWSSVAMDADGDFVVTWTAENQDGVGNGYGPNVNGKNGVFARRFGGPGGGALGSEFQVNTYAADDQQHSRVDMDADGDFVIVWESFRDNPQSTSDNSWGIYAQRYVRSELLGDQPWYGSNGELGGEFRVNSTTVGDQQFPGVALDDTGDCVVVWSGFGPGDDQGIFLQPIAKSADDAGPTVTAVYDMIHGDTGTDLHQVLEGVVLDRNVTELVITVGENLDTRGGMNSPSSVLNPANWQLTRDGDLMGEAISLIDFGYNPLTAKYEIRLQLDGDPATAGREPLPEGEYVLTADDRIEDLFGNRFDGNLDGKPGGDFNLTFAVYTGSVGPGGPSGPGTPSPEDEDHPINMVIRDRQDQPVVASDALGNYVAVWTSYATIQGGAAGVEANIIAQRFDRFGQKLGGEFLVNTYTSGDQSQPDVAMDEFGNFVVVWAGKGEEDEDGVYARRFDAFGQPLDDEEFCVNVYKRYNQYAPRVALDADGDFVVTWTSFGQDNDRDGVFARRYNFLGQPKDNASEFQVNTYTANRQRNSDVAMDVNGDFTIVWMSDQQDGSSWGVVGQRFDAAGRKLGGEFLVNQYTNDKQLDPQIAMDADGDFVVAWSSFNQLQNGYEVYARRYSKAGAALSNEFRVNETTAGYQYQPDVSMDDDGNFVVTWSTFNQEGRDWEGVENRSYAVFARMYDANGVARHGEWRVNASTEGDQVDSAVAMDADGDFTVLWVGPDEFNTGIFQRVVAVNPQTYRSEFTPAGYGYAELNQAIAYIVPGTLDLEGTTGDDLFEFVAGPTRSSWIIKLNGEPQTVTAHLTSIRIDGLGGKDTVRITGTEADESVELWSDHLSFAGEDYTLDARNVEVVVIDGKDGNDVALFHDSAGDDTLVARPTRTTLSSTDFSQTVSNFEIVKAFAEAGGVDVALLYDSAGDDTFVGTPLYGELSGDGFSLRAESFEYLHGMANAGGNDTAELHDSAGNDMAVLNPVYGQIAGDDFFVRARRFETVTAFSTAGGYDIVSFVDSLHNDVFTATPTSGEMTSPEHHVIAKDFERMYARATGGYDIAVLHDSPGDDQFTTYPASKTTVFQVDGCYYKTMRFELVQAISSAGGTDVAELYDSAGNDEFWGNPEEGVMKGSGIKNIATGFDYLHGYSMEGGVDVAYLYDSTGDDTFVGRDRESRLYGEGFFVRAKLFDYVHGIARAGGNDTAYLFGTEGDDTYASSGYDARLFGNGYYNRARYFENVSVNAGGGTGDTAVLTSAKLQPSADPLPIGSTPSYIAWLAHFEQLNVKNKPEDGGDSTVDAVDEIFTAYWS